MLSGDEFVLSRDLQDVAEALREYVKLDLRKSYLIIGALIVIGAVLNIFLAHGWTVWPFVMAAGILTLVNEAAERNCQGLPPFQVYLIFCAALALWLATCVILSAINPLIFLIGVAAVLYRCGQAYVKQRERDRLVATRRAQGLCIVCGSTYDPNYTFCENCGDEPNPEQAMLKRVASIYRSPETVARTRALLTPAAVTAGAAAKERALLARRRAGKNVPLPKAAKLGKPSVSSKRK